jgi:uncharacterized coiled-coil DUF342 family protein
MAKTADQYNAEIRDIDEKIKSLNSKKIEIKKRLGELEEREILSLARQLQKSGKLEEARGLLAGENSQKPASVPPGQVPEKG